MKHKLSCGLRGRRALGLALLVGPLGLAACGSSGSSGSPADGGTDSGVGVCGDDTETMTRPASWTFESHCPKAPVGYAEVFDATKVRRLDITIDATVFAQGSADLKSVVAAAAGGDLDAIANPMWMSATLAYNSKVWTNVGVRWKGHASLAGAYNNGNRKLSMKVDFDAFEDTSPELMNQKFYGFKGFALGNAYSDPSFIRDKTAADVFRAAGVPAPRGSFTQVYLDVGSGPFYMGMYTIIEEPEDRMIETQVGDDSGNLYKPWGDAARWPAIGDTAVAGGTTTVADIQTYFEKATNEDTSDWSDIIAAFNALHADRTDAATWRANLESVFDVQSFLKALAVNQTMVNWDSYGCMTHNYLVYANPLNQNRFMWLPWDLNESVRAAEHDNCAPNSVMLDELLEGGTVTRDWPLIKYILGDETYRANYKGYLRSTLDGPFAAATIKAQMQIDHDLVAPYLDGTIAAENATIVGPFSDDTYLYRNSSPVAFGKSLVDASDATAGMFVHVDNRHVAVEAALATP